MIIIVYSKLNAARLEQELGVSEYSYYFVLKEFQPILERIGSVVIVTHPEHEVDTIYRLARLRGEDCVFLSFSPPHQTEINLECPTISVFAWEFSTIPDSEWGGEPRNNWHMVLSRLGRAITHSSAAVRAVHAALGEEFPVVSIPAPVWNRFQATRKKYPPTTMPAPVELQVAGIVVDSRTFDLSSFSPEGKATGKPFRLPEPGTKDAPVSVHIDGVVYTTVFSPYDWRKNVFDMVCGFGMAFRDVPDATLVLKLTHYDSANALYAFAGDLYKIGPIGCRIVFIASYLSDEDYGKLLGATTYTLNTSHGEGQCLPLMEYMSCGRPAVAPAHSGMADYVTPGNSFVVKSSAEPSNWPHDPRVAIRTLRHRLNFTSLLEAYRESYLVAKTDPARYARMSEQASRDLMAYCSEEIAEQRLRQFLRSPASIDTNFPENRVECGLTP